jgi:hypothetical protein
MAPPHSSGSHNIKNEFFATAVEELCHMQRILSSSNREVLEM